MEEIGLDSSVLQASSFLVLALAILLFFKDIPSYLSVDYSYILSSQKYLYIRLKSFSENKETMACYNTSQTTYSSSNQTYTSLNRMPASDRSVQDSPSPRPFPPNPPPSPA